MKTLYISCNVVVRQEIEDLLEKAKASRYDVIPQTFFYTSEGEPRMDTSIWPGYNVSFLVFEKDVQKIENIIKLLREFNEQCKFTEEKVEVYVFENHRVL